MSGMSESKEQSERRGVGLSRVPFEALVEIAAPEGTAFEAESIDLSTSGMHLRTAYLPKIGTPLSFRFESDGGKDAVIATGEVVWSADGEFGVRFIDMGPSDAKAIRQIVGDHVSGSPIKPGASVRIHIDGVSNPMRATLRDEQGPRAVVGSELKMLRIGAVVELEDKEQKTRKTARIDAVDCEIDPSSNVPQLVVKLRYDVDGKPIAEPIATRPDGERAPSPRELVAAADATSDATDRKSEPQTRPSLPVAASGSRLGAIGAGFGGGMKTVGGKMMEAFASAGAAASKLGARAKTTAMLLAKRGDASSSIRDGASEGADGPRRTTSPAPDTRAKSRALRPQGGSDQSASKGEEAAMHDMDEDKKISRRKQLGIAAGIGAVLVIGIFALRKPGNHQAVATASSAPLPELTPASASVSATPALPPPVDSALATAASTTAPPALAGDPTGSDAKGNPNPFGNSSVKHGTRMLLKLDGPITELRGMQMPNGFVVSVPNRKSMEGAASLASKDPRISSSNVQNKPAGAELTIAFKDAAPSYVVRVKGDALEIVLAHDKAIAKKGKNKGGVPATKGAAKHK